MGTLKTTDAPRDRCLRGTAARLGHRTADGTAASSRRRPARGRPRRPRCRRRDVQRHRRRQRRRRHARRVHGRARLVVHHLGRGQGGVADRGPDHRRVEQGDRRPAVSRAGRSCARGVRRAQREPAGRLPGRRRQDDRGAARQGTGQAAEAAQDPRARHAPRLRALLDPAGREDDGRDGQEDRRVDADDHLRRGRHQHREPEAVRRDLPRQQHRLLPRRSE